MKHQDFVKLALVGLSSGILVTSNLSAATKTTKSDKEASSKKEEQDVNDGNMNYHVMSEDELLMQLDSNGIAMYKSLDMEGKQLALLVASAMCDHTNECKGLNACQTDDHTCAGKGNCKGTGKCAFSDKNLAVKLVKEKMAAKRAKVNGNNQKNHSQK